MAVRGTASRGPCPQALGRPPPGPKAPVHKTRGSRRAGRAGEPAMGPRAGVGKPHLAVHLNGIAVDRRGNAGHVGKGWRGEQDKS